jgi:hypothetical protein
VNERRVTDRDRERTAELLREHTVMGSLPPEELEERTRRALAAETAADLAELTGDLPTLPEPPPTARLAERIPLRAHVAAYVVVNAILIALWLATRDPGRVSADRDFGRYWPVYLAILWGFVLAGHALLALRRPAVRRADRRRDLAS